jgi:mRNA interferase HicA
VNGREFVRRARRYARKTGLAFYLDTRRGKGSHVTVYVGSRHTIVKHGEISRPMLSAMLRQLGIVAEEF